MDLFALIIYGSVNLMMILFHLSERGRFYQFPFWAGVLGLGWFFPQIVGGYLNRADFPAGAYSAGLLFAALCMVALWVGFAVALRKAPTADSWMAVSFDRSRLFMVGMILCIVGFFFQWKLRTLPDELTSATMWSGAAVKYLFLGSIYLLGFLMVWLLYISQHRWMAPKLLLFIIPSLMFLIAAAVVHGRRAIMMDLVSYFAVGLWLVRRMALPRGLLLAGLVCGFLLINAIGPYRHIMKDDDTPLRERLSQVAEIDYAAFTSKITKVPGSELKNYLFYRKVHAEEGIYDYGLVHWNRLVFNFVPAQLVGHGIKNALMLSLGEDPRDLADQKYGFEYDSGTTSTGYKDAFGSFGWMGFIKFFLVGWVMGVLYRRAMQGFFLGQMLYLFFLGTAMHIISHGTHRFAAGWVYFFILGYPLLCWARVRVSREKHDATEQ